MLIWRPGLVQNLHSPAPARAWRQVHGANLACTQRRVLCRLSRTACSRQAFNALRGPPPPGVLLRLSSAGLLVAAASHQFWSMTEKAPAAGPVLKAASDVADSGPVDYASFYGEYHGHKAADLSRVLSALRTGKSGKKPVIYLAGDSSLDNKYWFDRSGREPACNGFEHAVTPPFSRPDVAWAINRRAADVHAPFVCINGAIEESTISDRRETLREQDIWIREHITEEDVLIVSVGGNDIALRPSVITMACVASLAKLSSDHAIDAGTAMGLGHFVTMFKNHVAEYIDAMTSKRRPKLVIVCMIYYPHERAGGSWADRVLSPLGYNSNPARLQRLIRKIYEVGTCEVRVPATRVIPCPLFEILDASPDSGDYIQRVEPSEAGSIKMARWFVDTVQREYGRDATDAAGAPSTAGTAATGGGLPGDSTAAAGAGGAGGSGATPA